MGLGRKLFTSSFAKAASEPILQQQNTQLALLQDKLRQIATTERAIAVQTMIGEQAAARNRFSEEAQNLRATLSQIGQSQRNAADRRGRIETKAAETGVAFIDQKDNATLLNHIGQLNSNIRSAETGQEAMEALHERQKWSLDYAAKNGVVIPDEAWDNPELLFEVVQRSAAEARRKEDRSNQPDFPMGMIDVIGDMGADGAALVDQQVAQWEMDGTPIDPDILMRMMAAKWKALGPDSQMEGFAKAVGIHDVRRDGIINKYFVDGLPSEMDIAIMEGGEERRKLMLAELDALNSDPVWSAYLMEETGFTTAQINSLAQDDWQSVIETNARMRGLTDDAEGRALQDEALADAALPAQAQQRTLQAGAEALLNEILPRAMAIADPSELEQLAVMYEERAVLFQDSSLPGEEYLTPEDYAGIAQYIREAIAVAFPEDPNQMVPFKNSMRPGGQ